MEFLKIEATKSTPEINFDFAAGLLEIKGQAKSTNALEFFQPLMLALEAYTEKAPPVTRVNLFLEYFSTSSSKCLLGILNELKKMNRRVTKVMVNWYYEEHDEDMLEAIKDYESLIDLNFKFIAVPEGGSI
jgi:SiaC family regulatory phosphoprotein